VIGIGLSACPAWLALAQMATPSPSVIPELDPVVVSAPREGGSFLDLPFSVTIVGAQELGNQAPRTLPEALAPIPGIMVQRTSSAQGSPYIRGFTGFRTLLLIDGIRLNNSVFREGPNQYWGLVDPYSIQQLELVRGPVSVLHGSDAIGGTVNVTPVSWTSREDGRTYGGRIHYRGSTAEASHSGRVEGGTELGKDWAAIAGATWMDFGDLQGGDGTGRQRKTGYDDSAFDVRLNGKLSEHQRLVVAHQTFGMDDAWRTHSTIYGSRWRGTTPSNDQERMLDQNRHLTYAQWFAEGLDGAVQDAHLSVSHQHQDEVQSRLRADGRREFTGFDVHTFGLSGQATLPTEWGRWVVGGEYYRDWVNSFWRRYKTTGELESVDIQGPVGDDAGYDLAGVFIENSLPALGPLELTVGSRFNHAAAEADRVKDPLSSTLTQISGSWSSVVGSLRALYRLDEPGRWRLFAGVSQGFRAPNLSDLSRFDIADGGQIETPSPDVSPEDFLTTEAGVRMNLERVTSEVAYFYTDIHNMVIRTPTGRIVSGKDEVTKRNSGEGYVHGVELSTVFALAPEWSLSGQATWMRGEISVYPTANVSFTVKEPLSRVMPPTARAALKWEQTGGRYWAQLSGTLADNQDRLAASDLRDLERIPPGGTPGYAFASIRFGWQPTADLSITLALENITDEEYRIHGSGLNEAGRSLVAALDWRF
jgi:hemoglobin/transferrin/lactoferrin receptor protein